MLKLPSTKTDTVPKSSPLGQDKKEVYFTNYGDNMTGITVTSHLFYEKVASMPSVAPKAAAPMSLEQREHERIKKARRRIKDIILANNFDVMAIITWRAKYKRCNPDIQNEELREFFDKLRKKYPGIKIFAVRHKNPDSEGYHVHVLFENLPRRALRIKKDKLDDCGRQTYCLLGWSRKGWASAEYIEKLKGVARYLSGRKKVASLPKGVHSIVFRGRNLISADRESWGMTDEEIADFLFKNKSSIEDNSYFSIDKGNGYKEHIRYVIANGRISSPEMMRGGAA